MRKNMAIHYFRHNKVMFLLPKHCIKHGTKG